MDRMTAFAEAYGKVGGVYSMSCGEEEEGYVSETMFVALYGERPGGLSDFAVFLGETLDGVDECGALVGETYSDALTLCEAAMERINLILSMEKAAGRDPGSFLSQYGKTVVYGVFSDPEKAEDLIDKIF